MESTWHDRMCRWIAEYLPRRVLFYAHCRWMVNAQDEIEAERTKRRRLGCGLPAEPERD